MNPDPPLGFGKLITVSAPRARLQSCHSDSVTRSAGSVIAATGLSIEHGMTNAPFPVENVLGRLTLKAFAS